MNPLLTLWPAAATRILAARTSELVKKSTDTAPVYGSIGCGDLSVGELAERFALFHREHIKLEMTDTTLHSVAIVALFDEQFNEHLDTILQACASTRHNMSLHVIALRNELARCLEYHSDDNSTASELTNFDLLDNASTDGPFAFSYTVIDDYAANGAPLNFTAAGLAEYLALILNSLINSYHSVLPPALLSQTTYRVIAMGAASIRFDREEASHFLLHRAFTAALEDAGINLNTVDAATASERAQRLLCAVADRYKRFYNDKVLPPLRDDNKEEAALVAETAPLLDSEFDNIRKELLSFITDASLTFPQREAVLALILGRDNPRLKGVQYDIDTLLLDDICTEPYDIYIDACNDSNSNILPVRGDYELLKKYVINPETGESEENPVNSKAFNPLREIKRLKLEILNATAFIRSKSEELRLLADADAKRRMAENMDDNGNEDTQEEKRRILEIKEQPLDEFYTPAANIKPKKAVDLRGFFSPVRDQGELGSCSTFATIAMYEALMNRCSQGSPDANMSEFFVYYHSNILNGKPEGGSNFYEQLAVLGRKGVCDESLFGYTTTELNKEPSQAAIEDAGKHRVLKALQIPLRDSGDKAECMRENHRLLTSALSEGYPVGISLQIYNNFSDKGAYINRPDDEDISSGGLGGHAMVLAGYSEADKCYIVRNSWGTDFGDKGYAYIAAPYIDDPEYNSFACIISSTTDSEQGKAADIPGTMAPFGGTETEIRMAAIRNAIDEQKILLGALEELYEAHYKYYQSLTQRLCMPQVRKAIRQLAEARLADSFNNIVMARTGLLNTFSDTLRQLRHRYIKHAIGWSLASLVAIAYTCTMFAYDAPYEPTLYGFITATGLTLLTVLIWMNYYWYKRRKRREYQEQLDNLKQIERNLGRELRETQLRFHVAGMWIDRFHSLSIDLGKTYDRLMGFNTNLHGWYIEDSQAVAVPPEHDNETIFCLNNTQLLDKYFHDNIRSIVGRIDLMATFSGYAIDRENIQEARERLRKTTLDAIRPLFADFRMADYLTGVNYPYLRPVRLGNIINRLIAVGQPSLRFNNTGTETPVYFQFINIPEPSLAKWQTASDSFYPFHPMTLLTDDPCSFDQLTIQPVAPSAMR